MAIGDYRSHFVAVHPLHAALVAGAAPLFAGALLSDIAYSSSAQVQWTNFASWLIVGAMVLTGLALVWALVGVIRPTGRTARSLLVLSLLAATFVIGFVNALDHTRDAWAVMPGSLILSIVCTVTALIAVWAAFLGGRQEAAR